MSHPNQPEYFTINSVCPHTGDVTSIGIFEDMDAVSYRLKRMYTTCGDEYRVECHHLSKAEDEAKAYNEQVVSRAKHKREEEMKEARLKEWEEHHEKWDELDEGFEQMMEGPELPNINAEHKTVGV